MICRSVSSASPAPGADIPCIAEILTRALLYNLVRSKEQALRYGETKGLGGLEVDDDLDFCSQLRRQVAWFFALQNPADIAAGDAPRLRTISSVTDQSASIREIAPLVDGEHHISRRQYHDLSHSGYEERAAFDHQARGVPV